MHELDGLVQFHDLKTWPEYFRAIQQGFKTFEIRKEDRGFAIGDELRLREWDPDTGKYTGAVIIRHVCYILNGGKFGLERGYVALGLCESMPLNWYLSRPL